MLHEARTPRPFDTPPWITTRIDDEAVERSRGVGGFTPAEERTPLLVDVVQRDDLSPDGDPALTRAHPAQVRMAGTRFSPDEARELARLLTAAATMITPRSTAGVQQQRSFNGGYGLAPLSPAPRGPAGGTGGTGGTARSPLPRSA